MTLEAVGRHLESPTLSQITGTGLGRALGLAYPRRVPCDVESGGGDAALLHLICAAPPPGIPTGRSYGSDRFRAQHAPRLLPTPASCAVGGSGTEALGVV